MKIKTIEFGLIFFTSILLFVFSSKKSAVFEQGVCFKFQLVQRCWKFIYICIISRLNEPNTKLLYFQTWFFRKKAVNIILALFSSWYGQSLWTDRHFASPFSMHLENSLYKQNKYIKVTDSIKILIYIKTLFILKKRKNRNWFK